MAKGSAMPFQVGEAAVDRLRGDRLRALLDAARDVAMGSDDPQLRALARRVMSQARVRGFAS